MTINYTTLLGLAKPVTGTESGVWGDVVNDQITSLLEDAIANAASISVTAGNVTLTDNNGSSDQSRMAILLVTGSPGVSRNIVAPSTSKWYIVKNSSNAEIVLKGSATTGVTIPAGAEAFAFWNGSDFELAAMIGPSSSTDNAVARFDGTTGKVVQNSAVTIADTTGSITTGGYVFTAAGAVGTPAYSTSGDTNTGMWFPAADTIAFSEGGTEVMRINSSGNVGIGTDSSGAKLEVTGDIQQTWAASMDRFVGSKFSTTYELGLHFIESSRETRIVSKAADSTGLISFYTGVTPTEKMRLDFSGNLGLGVTPSAWGSNYKAIESAGNSGFAISAANVNGINFVGNAYATNSNWIYKTTGAAAAYFLAELGTHKWYTAPSGTAGNAISFTQSMMLDNSGNLGLGVTPSAWIGAGYIDFPGNGYVGNAIAYSSNTLSTGLNTYYGTGAWRYKASSLAATRFEHSNGSFAWYTAPSGTAGNAISFTQAMTLDASGRLLVGRTSSAGSAYSLELDNGTSDNRIGMYAGSTLTGGLLCGTNELRMLGIGASTVLTFQTNGSERARITSGGDLLVGTTNGSFYTSANNKFAVVQGTSTNAGTAAILATNYSGDLGNAALYVSKYDNNNTTSQIFVKFLINQTGLGNGQINGNGSGAAAFGSWSDARLKENIVDLGPQLANICALRPVEFDYIQSEGGGHQIGFIAQEMEQVYPDAVGERQDGMKTIAAWSKTEARLVKAIQEQQAIIESLITRIAALESKGA